MNNATRIFLMVLASCISYRQTLAALPIFHSFDLATEDSFRMNYSFDFYTSHNQFYIVDSGSGFGDDMWNDKAIADRMALRERLCCGINSQLWPYKRRFENSQIRK